ncbi:hypothetical protein ONZ45_g13841 [Pleurotus djamor]|nr:hypothetical protein ONZ45_g13841 [Pleurotus djamor]
MNILLEALRNAPNLEVLRVYKVIAPSDDSMDHEFPVVHLPHLVDLEVSGYIISSSKLFQFLKYPRTASVAFECQSVSPNSDLSHLRNALAHFTSLPGRIIRDLEVITRDDFVIVLETVHRSSTDIFQLTLPASFVELPDKVAEILSVVPLSATPSLRLSGITRDTIQPSLLLGPCREIKVLALTACTVEVFRSMKKANRSDLPLPKLRKLTVEQCAFNISYEERDPEMCKALTTFLKQRKQMKAGLKELIIEDCDITMSVVDDFRKFTTVDWDYREIDSEKEEEEDHDDEEDWSDGEGAYIF